MADINRREFLKASSAVATLPVAGCIARPIPVRSPRASAIPERALDLVVNDIHSQLNATRIDALVKPSTVGEVQAAVVGARSAGKSISVAGGRHAMGGQQFGDASVLIDTRDLNRVLAFDQPRRQLLPDLPPLGAEGSGQQCYPQMRAFLAKKREYDPGEVFQSNWYRHYRAMFA